MFFTKSSAFNHDFDLWLEMAVMEHLGNAVFTQAVANFTISVTMSLEWKYIICRSTLTKYIIRVYLRVRSKTCAKAYSSTDCT